MRRLKYPALGSQGGAGRQMHRGARCDGQRGRGQMDQGTQMHGQMHVTLVVVWLGSTATTQTY